MEAPFRRHIAPERSRLATLTLVINASLAPAIAASINPDLIISQAIPKPSPPLAQAEATEKLGPRAPKSIEVIPAPPFDIYIALVKGFTRRGPFSLSTSAT